MKDTHSHHDQTSLARVTNREQLRLESRPYWLADGFDESARSARKTYYCTMMHGGVSGTELYRAFLAENEVADQKAMELKAIIEHLEAGPAPDLAGSILQARMEGESSHLTTKLYLAPIAKEGVGIRLAARRLAGVVAQYLGQGAAKEAYRKLLDRQALYPLFYISVALRPDLEIETYFDCEEFGEDVHSAEDILRLVCVQHGDRMPTSRIEEVLRIAQAHGFRCKQVAADLLGGDDEITLYLDRPKCGTPSDFRGILAQLLALDGRSMTDWTGSPLRLDKTLTPSLVGVKVQASAASKLQLVIEEMDHKVIDIL